MHALHSHMSELDYSIKPDVECPDNDPNDVAFILATATIGGHDVVEEYVVCKMYPLCARCIRWLPASSLKTWLST
jgi:hypothetical protein